MKSRLTNLLLACALALGFAPQWAEAQEADKAAQAVQPLSEGDAELVLHAVLLERARELVLRYLPANESHVAVRVKAKPTLTADLPYVPAAQTIDLVRRMKPEELQSHVATVEVEVLVTKRFDDETRQSIGALLRAELALPAGALKFGDLAVTVEKPDPALKRELEKQTERLEADLRAARTESEQLKRERNDAAAELAVAKTLFETKLKEQALANANAQKQIEKTTFGKDEKPEDKKEAAEDNKLLTLLPLLAAGGLALVVILLATRMFSSSIRSVGTGINMIAGALENVGGALKLKSDDKVETVAKEAPAEAPPVAAPVAPAAVGSGAALGDIQTRLLSLAEELTRGLNERTEGIILKRLSNALSRPETTAKGVATMELLGKEKANELFARLGKSARETVLHFLAHGNYGRPKGELMLEAGEELKTLLLGEHFGNLRGELTIRMANVLLQVAESDLAPIVAKMEGALRPRFFVYLESTKIAAIIQELDRTSPQIVDEVLDALPRIAEAERAIELDDRIIPLVEQQIASRTSDSAATYLPYFQDVIESLDGKLADRTVERISAGSPTLKRMLGIFVVTFKTFFRLPAAVQKEMLEPFGNKQIAALLHGADAEERKTIFASVAERRHGLINEELEILSGLNAREATAAYDQAKDALIANMKKLRASGALQGYLEGSEGGSAKGTAPKAA